VEVRRPDLTGIIMPSEYNQRLDAIEAKLEEAEKERAIVRGEIKALSDKVDENLPEIKTHLATICEIAVAWNNAKGFVRVVGWIIVIGRVLAAIVGLAGTIYVAGRIGWIPKVLGAIRVSLAAIAVALALVACRGSITYENKQTGEYVKVVQPPKPVAPAMLSRGSQPPASQPSNFVNQFWSFPLTASTGSQQTHDFAAEAQSRSLTWVGIALILAGIGSVVARAWFPIIPLQASLLSIVAGVAFLMLPNLLDNPLFMWGSLATLVALGAVGLMDNRHKLRSRATPLPASASSRSASP
jgi:hypothetical protein